MSIPSKTSNRAVEILFRVFVDFEGKKHVKSIRGKKYPMIISNNYSRYTCNRKISVRSQMMEATSVERCLANYAKGGTLNKILPQ